MNIRQLYISTFPEDLFPCAAERYKEYGESIIRGTEIAAQSNVLICGVVRNAAPILPYTLLRLERLSSFFSSYYIFLYENDSEDNTKEILQGWNYANTFVQSENVNPPIFPSPKCKERRVCLAKARNKYLKFARKYVTKSAVDYIIMVDLDLEGGWSYQGVMNSLGCSETWDVMGSNSIFFQKSTIDCEWVLTDGRYRCKHCGYVVPHSHYKKNCDVLRNNSDIQKGHQRLFYDSWAIRFWDEPKELSDSEANLFEFQRGDPPFRVNSCFGGLAIYKPRFLAERLNYTSADCDHPSLHNQLVKRGYNLFLNPSQITLYNKSVYVI